MKQEQESLSPESNCYGGPDLPEKEEEQWLREGGETREARWARSPRPRPVSLQRELLDRERK